MNPAGEVALLILLLFHDAIWRETRATNGGTRCAVVIACQRDVVHKLSWDLHVTAMLGTPAMFQSAGSDSIRRRRVHLNTEAVHKSCPDVQFMRRKNADTSMSESVGSIHTNHALPIGT